MSTCSSYWVWGFLLAAYEHMKGQTQNREKLRELRQKSFKGYDIVDEVVRLCAINLYLHGVGNGGSPVEQADALAGDPGERFDVLIGNPPFGRSRAAVSWTGMARSAPSGRMTSARTSSSRSRTSS